MIRFLLTIAGLDAIYLLTLRRLSVADAAAGALWAALLFWWFYDLVFGGARHRERRVHPLALLRLFTVTLGRALRSAAWVAGVALRGRPGAAAGFVEIPIGERTTAGVAMSCFADSVTPGSVTVDVDEARGVMLLHVLDAGNHDAVREDREQFYRRYQRAAIA